MRLRHSYIFGQELTCHGCWVGDGWDAVVPPDLVALVAHCVFWKRLGDVVLEVLDGHRAQVVQLIRDLVQPTQGRRVGGHVAENACHLV